MYTPVPPHPALSSPLRGDCVIMAGRGQRASFGSLRIAIILEEWETVLTLDMSVCMGIKPMILFVKMFRSKALSATSLSPGQLGDCRRIPFDFLTTPYCDTVSGEGGVRDGFAR